MMINLMNGRRAAIALAVWLSASGAGAAEWRPDEMIATKAKIGFYAIPSVDPDGITVESREGDVTLLGAVPSAEAKTKVVQTVHAIEGVKNVRDELQISAAPVSAAGRPADAATVKGEVVKQLSDDPELRDNSISVDAQSGGVVVLGGFANSLTDQLRALKITHGVAGVEMVRNEMKTPPETLHDMNIGEGSAQGADARNRRERQAREGLAVERQPGQAGDAPRDDAHPAEINPEGDAVHAPHAAD